MMKIGFVILSHNDPAQLLRLTETLSAAFVGCKIVCHHNFTQCGLDETLFPKAVQFVHPHVNTQWGHISLPEAALRSFRLMMRSNQPDWCFLLSGSDYPVRSAEEIRTELRAAQYDVYIDHREISGDAIQTASSGFGAPEWIPLAHDRYCRYPIPWPSRRFPFVRRKLVSFGGKMVLRLRIGKRKIYGGDFWFHANAMAINRLLGDSAIPRLIQFFSKKHIPEEAFFQTAFCNMDLLVCPDHKRYEDWSAGGAHPKLLDGSDLAKISASGAYFARKFPANAHVLDTLDGTLAKQVQPGSRLTALESPAR